MIRSDQGRPAKSSFRDWLYMATIPCRYTECPHDKEDPVQEMLKRRSPHFGKIDISDENDNNER